MTNLQIVNKAIADVFANVKKPEAMWWASNDKVLIATDMFGVKFSDIKVLEQAIASYGGNVKDIEISPLPGKNYALALMVMFESAK